MDFEKNKNRLVYRCLGKHLLTIRNFKSYLALKKVRERQTEKLQRQAGEGRSRSLGLADANYYIQDGQTRSYHVAQGTVQDIIQ